MEQEIHKYYSEASKQWVYTYSISYKYSWNSETTQNREIFASSYEAALRIFYKMHPCCVLVNTETSNETINSINSINSIF